MWDINTTLSFFTALGTVAMAVAFGWGLYIWKQQLKGTAQFDAARALQDAKPRVILFDTLMGKGVPFLEQREKNHFIRVDPPEWQQAIAHLDQTAPQGAAR